MSKFLNTLKTEQIGKWQHILIEDLVMEDDVLGIIKVPARFQTDFASIAVMHNVWLFVLYALLSGYGNYSATVHDLLYRNGGNATDEETKELIRALKASGYGRKEFDDVLYRGLRAEGVAKWRAWMFWAGVRLFGKSSYVE